MFRSLNITTKILVWEHNWDWPKYADSILQDSAAAQYVTGSSWHCYSGRHDEPGKFHEQHPTKDIYFTECSGTTNNNDKDIVWGFRLLMIGQMRNWARTVLLWNMALDEHDGPQVGVGGCPFCRGVVKPYQDGRFDKTIDYYIIGHMSKFVLPGAVRLYTPLYGWYDPHSVAFENADGSIVVVVLNPWWDRDETFYVSIDGQKFPFTLKPMTVATFVYRG